MDVLSARTFPSLPLPLPRPRPRGPKRREERRTRERQTTREAAEWGYIWEDSMRGTARRRERASERERERVRLDRQCARERATWQGCVHVCVPAEGRVSVCTVARVFVGRVVRVRVGGGGARTRRTGCACARGAWWWKSVESWRRSGPRHVCRLQRAGGHQSHGTCHIMSCTQPDTQPRP